MSSIPAVSIIVPCFNEPPDVLQKSLSSVAAQTFGNFECIVIDESTDPVRAEACRTFCDSDARFIYVRPSKRLGLSASLNLALEMAKADWVARFDSDDVCTPDRLQDQMQYLASHPDVDVLGGGLEIIDEAGNFLALRSYPAAHEMIARRLQLTTAIAHPTVIYRRDLVARSGGYDISFRFAEDLDLWLRLLNQGACFANLPQTLVYYRQQQTSRQTQHWQFNLKARLKNFNTQYLGYRLFGIAAVLVWRFVPQSLQKLVFRRLLLNTGSR